MSYYNSYIFLEREKIRNIREDEAKKNNIILLKTFPQILKDIFNDITFYYDGSSGIIIITINNQKVEVEFELYKVGKNYYLNVYVYNKKVIAMKTLAKLNEIFTKDVNNITKSYLPIITFDYVSKNYCDKLYPLLNEFERKLRKLLYNVYTINFDLKYYENTFLNLSDQSKSIKAKISGNVKNNISKEENYIILWFYSLDYGNISHLLFDEYIPQTNYLKVEQELKNNDDFSKLGDKKIRKLLKLLLPKSDWERYFTNKNLGNTFKKLFEDIHKSRNIIAHCKLIEYEQYFICKKNIIECTKLLDDAISKVEKSDTKLKNASINYESMQKIIAKLVEVQTLMSDNIQNCIQPILNLQKEIYNASKPVYEKIYDIIKNTKD